MGVFKVHNLQGGVTEVDMTALEVLDNSVRGQVLLPASEGYEDARRIWNGMIDRHPAIITRCAGTADVVAAVKFARENDLLLSVKGGGHNVSGNAVCEGGMMIDLSEMRGVHADPVRCRARAEGGATWGDFDAETQIEGLATTGGLISATGVAGLTLGGGIGWLSPSYGLACDNLVSIDLVTADGRRVTASDNENADLFWGIKGGSGNFGVATSFEFRVHPVGPAIFAGMTAYAIEDASHVLANVRDFMDSAPDRLGATVVFTTLPGGQAAIAVIGVYNGEIVEGERVVAPLRRLAPALADSFGETTYRKIQTFFDAGAPSGFRYYWKSSFLDALPADGIHTVIEWARKRPSPDSKIFVEFLGGELARIPRDSAVFDHRDSPYNLLVIGAWTNPLEDGANRSWARDTWESMQPHASSRVYVNYLGTEADEGDDRVRSAYGPGKYEKLVELKRKYDPANLFRMNQNIRP